MDSDRLMRFRPPRRSPLSHDSGKDDDESSLRPAKRRRTSISPADSEQLPPELYSRLKEFALFKEAPEAFLHTLGKSLRLVQYMPQEYIVKFGEPAKSMYWILRGTVGVVSMDGEALYAELAAGSFFGEIGILFNRPRTATVVARTKVLLGILTKDSLTQVLSSFPAVERFIRDEGQERLAMQEKRKRVSPHSSESGTGVTRAPGSHIQMVRPSPGITTRHHSSVHYNDSPYNTSLLASAATPAPGPSIPPILTYVSEQAGEMPRPINDGRKDRLPSFYQLPSFVEGGVPAAAKGSAVAASFSAMPQLKPQHIYRPSISAAAVDSIDNSISTREFLSNLPIFKNVPQHVFHELALAVEIVHLKPMDYIVRKGERGRDIFFVVSGEVEVLNPRSVNSGVLARLGPMKYFGEMAFSASLNAGPEDTDTDIRSADVRAVTDCDILVLKSNTLEEICTKWPSVREDMKRTASERMHSNDSVGDLIQAGQIAPTDRITVDSLIAKSGQQPPPPPVLQTEVELPPTPPDSTTTEFGGFQSFSFSGRKKEHGRNKTIDIEPMAPMVSGSTSIEGVHASAVTAAGVTAAGPAVPSPGGSGGAVIMDRRRGSIRMNVPDMNPVPGSIYRFNSPLNREPFQYTPLSDRRRLHTFGARRRRSSLAVSGPFPDSITIKIFQNLDLPNLMRISRVCRRWKQLIYLSEDLLTELDLRPWSKEIDDKVLIEITKFVGSRPRTIDVSNCYHITDESFCYLINEVGLRGSLTELRMRDDWNISAMAIMDLSVCGRQLESIDLSNCRKVRDDVIERLLVDDPKYGCPGLKSFDLSYCKYLTDRTMLMLAKHASERLTSLNLTRCTTISDNGYCFWAETTFPRLKKLVLRDCTFISDNAISSIATSCPYLEYLDLTFCCVLTDNALAILFLFCKHLKYLNLSFCGSAVSDNSLLSVARMPQLEELYTTGCVRVTREGVDTVVANSPKIRLIDLSQCPRVNTYRGKEVAPFAKVPGTKYARLRVNPHERIIRVVL